MEVIEDSHSEWNSAIVLVPNINKAVHFSVYFCKVNEVFTFDSYSMASINELLNWLGMAKAKGKWHSPPHLVYTNLSHFHSGFSGCQLCFKA